MHNGKRVILLVEDSEIVRKMTHVALEEAGFEVRSVEGNNDLDLQIKTQPGYLDGVDLLVLDMELWERQERMRQDKTGSHVASQMTGSQMGIALALAHPQLQTVPFLLYSGRLVEEIQAYLDELQGFLELDDQIKNNYQGFIPKQQGAEAILIEKIRDIFAANSLS